MLAKVARSKITPVGLDIGETALRAAQLRRGLNGFAITALAQVERVVSAGGPSATGNGQPQPLEQGLRRLFSLSAFKGRSVVTALNPPEVEFHVLEMPQAALQGGENANKVIHWEIGRLTSLSPSRSKRHWLPPRAWAVRPTRWACPPGVTQLWVSSKHAIVGAFIARASIPPPPYTGSGNFFGRGARLRFGACSTLARGSPD
jgi:hypothetical protein